MADQGTDTQQDASPAFDVGDTDLHFQRPSVPERNPDGTFKSAAPTEPAEAADAPIPVTPAETITPVSPTPTHPAYLIERAADLGFSPEDIADISTAALDRLLWKTARQQSKLREDLATERLRQDATVRQPEPARTPPAVPGTPPADDIDWGVDETGKPYTEADYGPVVVKFMKSQHAKTKALEAKLEASDLRQQAREARSASDLIDAAFAKLGEPYHRLLGKDALGTVPPKDMTPEQKSAFKRRLAVITEAGLNVNQLNRSTIVAQLKAAADTLYQPPEAAPAGAGNYAAKPNGTPIVTPAPAAIPVAEWNGAAVAKPTARKGGKEVKGDALAVANLEQRMRESGALGDASDSDIDDGLFG